MKQARKIRKGMKMLYEFDGKSPRIGAGSYVSETAILVGDVMIGDNCYIGHGAILRGDYGSIMIGSGSAIEEGVVIHAPPKEICDIGKMVTVGHGAIIHAASVGEFAVIGMGAVLSVRSRIGKHSIIAEGAVVKMTQEIPDNVVAGGNPAKVIRNVQRKDEEFWRMGKQIYIDLAKKYLAIRMKKISRDGPG
jgi:carbonic anhydrase/acetyltransferase-like protein (isoleucine patch superfamily)